MPCSRSPESPVRSAGSTGTPPATDAPNPRLLLSLDITMADMGEADWPIAAFGENLGHSAAHGSETYQGNTARGRARVRVVGGCGHCRFRSLFRQSLFSRQGYVSIHNTCGTDFRAVQRGMPGWTRGPYGRGIRHEPVPATRAASPPVIGL